jgi:hypothetical protein
MVTSVGGTSGVVQENDQVLIAELGAGSSGQARGRQKTAVPEHLHARPGQVRVGRHLLAPPPDPPTTRTA